MRIKIDRESAELGDTVILEISGKIVLIDKEDAPRITCYNWFLRRVRSRYYAVRKVKSKNKTFLVHMHRQIMHCPTGKIVHHINRNGLDNRKENLRVMFQKEHHILHRFC